MSDTPVPGTPAPATPDATPPPAATATHTEGGAPPTDGGAPTPDGGMPPAEPPAKPLDWADLRTKYAKGDEKLEKRLARYSSVEAALDAMLAAQNKIASGALKEGKPADATPEQLAEWRAQNGIPEKPEDYKIELSDGRTMGEDDKAFVDGFLKYAHESDMTPAQVNKAVEWYQQAQEQQILARQQADAAFHEEAVNTMREEWGSEYKLNVNLIGNLLDGAPEGVKDNVLGARLANGTALGDDPATLRWLASLAREVNPVATVVPGSGGNAVQAIETEIANIEKLMGDRNSEYWKGPTANKMQSRYRDLIEAKSRVR